MRQLFPYLSDWSVHQAVINEALAKLTMQTLLYNVDHRTIVLSGTPVYNKKKRLFFEI